MNQGKRTPNERRHECAGGQAADLFHPDYTVGFGIAPNLLTPSFEERSRACGKAAYRRWGIAPRPEIIIHQIGRQYLIKAKRSSAQWFFGDVGETMSLTSSNARLLCGDMLKFSGLGVELQSALSLGGLFRLAQKQVRRDEAAKKGAYTPTIFPTKTSGARAGRSPWDQKENAIVLGFAPRTSPFCTAAFCSELGTHHAIRGLTPRARR